MKYTANILCDGGIDTVNTLCGLPFTKWPTEVTQSAGRGSRLVRVIFLIFFSLNKHVEHSRCVRDKNGGVSVSSRSSPLAVLKFN